MGSKIGVKLLVGLIALGLNACVMHTRRSSSPPLDYQYTAPERAIPELHYTPNGPVELSEPIERLPHHEVLRLLYSSGGNNGHPQNRVEGLYFRSLSPGAKKLVIVLPIWGSSTYPSRKIAHGYAKRSRGDANIVWILGETPLFPWESLKSSRSEQEFIRVATDSAERYRSAVIDVRRLLDWADSRAEIDAERIALVSFSMSALTAATLMGNDARISAGVLMMGAANYSEVFAACEGQPMNVRDHVLKSYGWTVDEYRDFFEGLFGAGDPVRFSGRYDPEKILMIDATFDDCMPSSSRDALWQATGRPERISLLYRHKRAFYSLTPLGLNFVRRKIYRFLDETL